MAQASEKEAIASNVKGDVVAELLPLVDNFELARTQVKVESEGENKINSSYQVCCLHAQLNGRAWSWDFGWYWDFA